MSAPLSPGRLVISLDFEIGWGVWESERWRARQARDVYRDLRPALRRFVDFLDARQLALTWATVGAMVSPRADGEFDYLPGAARDHIHRFLAEAAPDTIDGRDLFDIVSGARTPQHFASHSYSHTRFDYAGMTGEALTTDLARSTARMAELGHPVDALVFPENIVAHWDALAANGIRVGRLPAPQVRPTGLGPLDRVLSRTIAAPPLAQDSAGGTGVAAHSGSLFFNWYGAALSLRRAMVERQARLGLAEAVRTGGTLHLWLHPFNLTDTPDMVGALERFLNEAAVQRDQGRLDIVSF